MSRTILAVHRRPLRYPLTEGGGAGLTAVQNGRYYEIPGLPLRLDELPAVREPGAGHLVAGESAVSGAVRL